MFKILASRMPKLQQITNHFKLNTFSFKKFCYLQPSHFQQSFEQVVLEASVNDVRPSIYENCLNMDLLTGDIENLRIPNTQVINPTSCILKGRNSKHPKRVSSF